MCLCGAGFRSEVDGSGVRTCVGVWGRHVCRGSRGQRVRGRDWRDRLCAVRERVPARPTASELPAGRTHTDAKAGTAETAETGKAGNTGGLSASLLLAILLAGAVCIALFPRLLGWVRGRLLARVRGAEAPFETRAALPAGACMNARVARRVSVRSNRNLRAQGNVFLSYTSTQPAPARPTPVQRARVEK